MNANHLATGKKLRQNIQRDAIVGIVEGWHEYEAVGDVEICVAGWHALGAKNNRPRHGQLNDGELLALWSARGFEAREVFSQRSVVGIARVGLNSRDDSCGRDKASDVIDVAVRIVADDTAAKPDGLVYAEIVAEAALKLCAADAGVPLLHLAQQALFRCEQRSCPVNVDGTAFEDDATVLRAVFNLDCRLPCSRAEQFGYAAGELVVEMPVRIFCPAIKLPISERNTALRAAHKNRPRVARPAAVGRPAVEGDLIEIRAGAAKHGRDAFLR